jgi:hypothetical protein
MDEAPDERPDDAAEDAAEDGASPADVEVPDAPPADGAEGPDDAEGSDRAASHPAVNEVLRSLERLDDLPVEEHVAVFEEAHEELRRTLTDARDHGE